MARKLITDFKDGFLQLDLLLEVGSHPHLDTVN